MTSSQPPILATWLLKHFLPGSKNDHIMGDLIEAFHSGRSRIWYWKEVLAAIAVGFSKETIRQPFLMLRGLSIGWAAVLLAYYGFGPAVFRFVVRRLARPSGYPFAPSTLIWIAAVLLTLIGSGWIVGRLHRHNRIATVVPFAISVFIFQLRGVPFIWSSAANSLTNTRFLPYLIYSLGIQILWPAAILFGGLYLARPSNLDSVQFRSHIMQGNDTRPVN